jgi:hypothetical protein
MDNEISVADYRKSLFLEQNKSRVTWQTVDNELSRNVPNAAVSLCESLPGICSFLNMRL